MRFLLFCMLLLPLYAFSILNTPQNVKIVDVGSDVLKVSFNWQQPNLSGRFTTTFRIYARNLTTNQVTQTTSIITGSIPNKVEYIDVATNLLPNSSYRISVRIEVLGLDYLYFDNSLTSSESPSSTTANRKYGITVLTHGFQLTGNFPDAFEDYANDLKNRLNGNATIYKSKHENGLDYWDLVGSNNGGELIFLYDWASISNGITSTGSLGQLEYAADRLFALLIQPRTKNGNSIRGYNLSGEMLKNNPSHFIGHSRGGVMLLQVLHRLNEHFPNITIEQFTGLDPHPASTFGDIDSSIGNVNYNLPCVYGFATGCNLMCSDGRSVQLAVPSNVTYANNFYRKDGNYEDVTSTVTFAPFDGVRLDGCTNLELNNYQLSRATACGGTFLGGAHSAVHYWYFSTVNLTQCINVNWYSSNVDRTFSGFYHTRLGGGLHNLQQPSYRISNQIMDTAIKKRQNGKPLQLIFNGDFEYPVSEEWESNRTLNTIQVNGVIQFLNSLNPNFIKLGHKQFYIPNNKKYLNFSVIDHDIKENSLVHIDWYVGKSKVTTIGPQCLKGASSFSVEIPKTLLGKVARFELTFNNSSGIVGEFSIDMFDISESPNGKIINNEGYCCNHGVTIQPANSQFICEGESVTFTANATNPSSYKWFKNGKQVGSGATITADTTASYSVLAQKNGAECIASASVSVTMVKNTTMNFKLNATIPDNNQCAFDSTSKTITLCAGQSTTLTGTGCDGIVIWNTGVTANAITVNQAGNYAATCRIGHNCLKSDNVVVKIETATTPTIANAGTDNAYCGKQTITLNGNAPTAGCGTWSIVSPTGADVGTFSDMHNPKATFTPMQFGTYRLQWTISLVCGNNSSSDLVDLNFVERKVVKELFYKKINPIDEICANPYIVIASQIGGIFYLKLPDNSYRPYMNTFFIYPNKISIYNCDWFPPNRFGYFEVKYVIDNPPCPVSEKTLKFPGHY